MIELFDSNLFRIDQFEDYLKETKKTDLNLIAFIKLRTWNKWNKKKWNIWNDLV